MHNVFNVFSKLAKRCGRSSESEIEFKNMVEALLNIVYYAFLAGLGYILAADDYNMFSGYLFKEYSRVCVQHRLEEPDYSDCFENTLNFKSMVI